MKRFALILSIVFVALTFVGTGYVISNNVDAWYAVIPMVFAVAFHSIGRKDE